MPAGYSFRPRLWPLALAAAACAAGIALGTWQARKADAKRELGARLERVTVEGEFVPQYTIYLDNKVRRGKAGYEVVTPLKLRRSPAHVLVNRGWIEGGGREALPDVPTPRGTVRLEGIALERLPRPLQLKEESRSRLRQSLEVGSYAAETGLAFEPRVIEQHSSIPDDGLSRDWPRHDAGIEKHEGYALQWYSLAVLAVVLAIVLSFKKIEAGPK
jgi:surfeit locus 1 family protein